MAQLCENSYKYNRQIGQKTHNTSIYIVISKNLCNCSEHYNTHVFNWSALVLSNKGNRQECTNVHMGNNNNSIPLSSLEQGEASCNKTLFMLL